MCFLCFGSVTNTVEPSSSLPKTSLLKLSYRSLLKATNGFSSSNLIGVSGFGSVYKGTLDEGGKVVAVKVLNLQHRRASKSFMAECEALRNIRHRNLVKVLSVCSGFDHQGNEFKALVYELMANRSLEVWLHPSNPRRGEGPTRSLSLLQRLNIAIDVASALDYLHHHCHASIVHGDINTTNVFLDSEMTAHVGGFGSATLTGEDTTQEYTSRSKVPTTYGDVYSFGILLLEMFTGKRPSDAKFRNDLGLHNHVKAALPDKVVEVADPILLQEIQPSGSNNQSQRQLRIRKTNIQCLILICRIGVTCSAELPSKRMKISDVIAALHSTRGILSGT